MTLSRYLEQRMRHEVLKDPRRYTLISYPRWGNSEKTMILAVVRVGHARSTNLVAISQNDQNDYHRRLFQDLIDGKYGTIFDG